MPIREDMQKTPSWNDGHWKAESRRPHRRLLIGSKRLPKVGTKSQPLLSGVANGLPAGSASVSDNKLGWLWAALALVFTALFGSASLSWINGDPLAK